jgi:hypothetical protein
MNEPAAGGRYSCPLAAISASLPFKAAECLEHLVIHIMNCILTRHWQKGIQPKDSE